MGESLRVESGRGRCARARPSVWDTVSALIDPDRQDEALKLINEFEIEDASTVRAIPGAKELLSTVPAGSWAVVTSGLTRLAQARMSAAGLPLPSVLVTADPWEWESPSRKVTSWRPTGLVSARSASW